MNGRPSGWKWWLYNRGSPFFVTKTRKLYLHSHLFLDVLHSLMMCLNDLGHTWIKVFGEIKILIHLVIISAGQIKLTHIQTAVKLRPPQSHRLKSRKQLTGIKYWSVKKYNQGASPRSESIVISAPTSSLCCSNMLTFNSTVSRDLIRLWLAFSNSWRKLMNLTINLKDNN